MHGNLTWTAVPDVLKSRPMKELTARQSEVLQFLRESHQRTGIMPSTREILQHFGFANQTAAVNFIRALESKGALRKNPRKARSIAVVEDIEREPVVHLPIDGSIAAGMPSSVEQETLGTIAIGAVTGGLREGAATFALRVTGDSMINAGIYDGDTVLLTKREPRDGDVVAALIDGETTLKTFVRLKGRAYLRAENPSYQDLWPVQELSVQGVVVALVRRY